MKGSTVCETHFNEGYQVVKFSVDVDDSFCQSESEESNESEVESSASYSDWSESEVEEITYSNSDDEARRPSDSKKNQLKKIDREMKGKLLELKSMMKNSSLSESLELVEGLTHIKSCLRSRKGLTKRGNMMKVSVL